MKRTFAAIILATSAISITACQNGNKYVAPNLESQAAAIITGSKHHNPSPASPDLRAYLVTVDGKNTYYPYYAWDQRTLVSPGLHNITVRVSSKSLFPIVHDAWGFGSEQVMLEAGKTYTIRATDPVDVTSVCANSIAWLETEDGQQVGGRMPVMVALFTGGEIPVSGGGFVSLPSTTRCPEK